MEEENKAKVECPQELLHPLRSVTKFVQKEKKKSESTFPIS